MQKTLTEPLLFDKLQGKSNCPVNRLALKASTDSPQGNPQHLNTQLSHTTPSSLDVYQNKMKQGRQKQEASLLRAANHE